MSYTTYGPVRDTCGHRHQYVHTAQNCIRKDEREVRKVNGPHSYSDRVVIQYADLPSPGERVPASKMVVEW